MFFSEDSDSDRQIKIDGYIYQISKIKEGGMGRVLLLDRISEVDSFVDTLVSGTKYSNNKYFSVYQKKLAAKTFKKMETGPETEDVFLRELNLWLNLENDHVAELLKIVKIKDTLFALMPVYDCSLRDVINEDKRLDIEEVKRVIAQIAFALDKVSSEYGIIHLDLKPENILVNKTEEGNIYFVADWGIASIQGGCCKKKPSNDHLPESYANTMSQMGTLPYMAPERLMGSSTKLQADIYSIGIITYEMLLGSLPYDLKLDMPLELQILSGFYYENAKENMQNKLDSHVANIILKCIEPNPTNRYANYVALIKTVRKIGRHGWFPFI